MTDRPITPPHSAEKLPKNAIRQSPPSYRCPTEIPGKEKRDSYPSPAASPKQEPSRTSPRHKASGEHRSPTSEARNHGNSLTGLSSGTHSQSILDQIKKDAKSANRAPHLRKSHQIRPDILDKLSTVAGPPYHHEGPYDASLFARNQDDRSSPLHALDHSNRETLKATPPEKILDSVRGHRPLDGVATYAPGEIDRNGTIYDYQQGDNMMILGGNPEGGAYKRWPGLTYHPDDVKGKGEPSYSVEKALKGHKKALSTGEIEMTTTPQYAGDNEMWGDGDGPALQRRVGSLKKRLGSVRKRLHREQ